MMLKCTNSDLAKHFTCDFGDRYWANSSGIQSEILDENETAVKNDVQNWLMNTPNSLKVEGGIQRFASAILFNDPKSGNLHSLNRIYHHGF